LTDTKVLKRKQFGVICFVEMWERYAFYSFQTLFMLFFTSRAVGESQGYLIFGIFSGLLWVFPTFGGALADKVIGIKRALKFGGLLLAIGYLMLAFVNTSHLLMLALAFIIVGNGIFKPAPSALVSLIFNEDATQSKSTFSIYYMAVNIGATLGSLIGPYIALYYNFHIAFMIAFLGMIISLLNLLLRLKVLDTVNGALDKVKLSRYSWFGLLSFSIFGVLISYGLLNLEDVTPYLIMVVWLLGLGYLVRVTLNVKDVEMKIKQFIGIILFIEAVPFFIMYNQMFSTITMFAKHNVDLMLFGLPISAGSFSAFDSIWIMILGPILALLYISLKKLKISFDLLTKYILGTMCAGIAFILLALISMYFNHGAMISANWLVVYFFFGALAELLVAAMGFAIAGLYFSSEIVSIAMGVFMLSLAQGGNLTGLLAQYVVIPSNITDKFLSLHIFIHYFFVLGVICIAMSFLYFCVAKVIRVIAAKYKIILP
jgi:proton-dependent oligopeptide transporter, POT family